MDMALILFFVAASVGGTAVIAFAIQRTAKQRQAVKELAARKGWTHEYHKLRNGSDTVIADSAEGWQVKLCHRAGNTTGATGSGSGSVNSWSDFEAPEHWIEGLAVIGPEVPEKTKEMADKFMGSFGGNRIVQWMLSRLTGGLGDEVAELRTVEAEGPGTLMATPGAEDALQDLRFAPELHNARLGRNEAQQPIVIRGSFGLRIRMDQRMRKPDDVEAFVALGRALSDNLRSG